MQAHPCILALFFENIPNLFSISDLNLIKKIVSEYFDLFISFSLFFFFKKKKREKKREERSFFPTKKMASNSQAAQRRKLLSSSMPFDDSHFPKDKQSSTYQDLDEAKYEELYQESINSPETFWTRVAKEQVDWFQPFPRALSGDLTHGDFTWFAGGKLNVAYGFSFFLIFLLFFFLSCSFFY